MKAISQKKYTGLDGNIDEGTGDLLIYGTNVRTGRRELICLYKEDSGFEALYHLKSVLNKQQIRDVRAWIAKFNPKFEVQI